MALPSITFDVGVIDAIGTVQVTMAESTIRDAAQFVQARRVNSPKRSWVLTWNSVPMESVEAVLDLWRRTFGGASRMRFVAPDQEGIFAVRFAPGGLRWTQLSHRLGAMSVVLAEV